MKKRNQKTLESNKQAIHTWKRMKTHLASCMMLKIGPSILSLKLQELSKRDKYTRQTSDMQIREVQQLKTSEQVQIGIQIACKSNAEL